jgi:hypothetical protein
LKLEKEEVFAQGSPALAAVLLQLRSVAEAAEERGGATQTLDPVKDLKMNDMALVTKIRDRQELMQVDFAPPAGLLTTPCGCLKIARHRV